MGPSAASFGSFRRMSRVDEQVRRRWLARGRRPRCSSSCCVTWASSIGPERRVPRRGHRRRSAPRRSRRARRRRRGVTPRRGARPEDIEVHAVGAVPAVRSSTSRSSVAARGAAGCRYVARFRWYGASARAGTPRRAATDESDVRRARAAAAWSPGRCSTTRPSSAGCSSRAAARATRWSRAGTGSRPRPPAPGSSGDRGRPPRSTRCGCSTWSTPTSRAVTRLGDLYREARFSEHELTEDRPPGGARGPRHDPPHDRRPAHERLRRSRWWRRLAGGVAVLRGARGAAAASSRPTPTRSGWRCWSATCVGVLGLIRRRADRRGRVAGTSTVEQPSVRTGRRPAAVALREPARGHRARQVPRHRPAGPAAAGSPTRCCASGTASPATTRARPSCSGPSSPPSSTGPARRLAPTEIDRYLTRIEEL